MTETVKYMKLELVGVVLEGLFLVSSCVQFFGRLRYDPHSPAAGSYCCSRSSRRVSSLITDRITEAKISKTEIQIQEILLTVNRKP